MTLSTIRFNFLEGEMKMTKCLTFVSLVLGLVSLVTVVDSLRCSQFATTITVGGITRRAKCSYADCPSISCALVTNSNPAKCQHFDDYLFAADYSCSSDNNYDCSRSDYGGCYDKVVCTKVEGITCNAETSCDGGGHTPCTTTQFSSYDNCEDFLITE